MKELNTENDPKRPEKSNWHKIKAEIFWGEIASNDHVVQIYEQEAVFLDALLGFVGAGINSGDCTIVIATAEHLNDLNDHLREYVVRIDTLISDGRIIPLDANEMLSRFMVNDWPDEKLFMDCFLPLLKQAKRNHRKVRAFGEMVVILMERGLVEATAELEKLWNKLCKMEEFCLFCAYPKNVFNENGPSSSTHICNLHSKMIAGSEKQMKEIFYIENN
jgi:hypothetical protein